MTTELLDQLESIFERKRGKKPSMRHRDRYGAKPPSGSQVSSGFKRARQGLTDLMALLARDAAGDSEALHRLSTLNRDLHEIQRDMDLGEEDESEIEDVA